MKKLIIVVLLLMATNVQATSGNNLLSSDSYIGSEEFKLAYTMGIADALSSTGDLCIPTDGSVTNGQLCDILIKYIKDNPKERHNNGSYLFYKATIDKWPCPTKKDK